MDGQVIEGSEISVAISNPPPRNAPLSDKQSTFVPSLGGGKKDNKSVALCCLKALKWAFLLEN